MKTQYGLYAIYDADVQAFMPDTLSVFITDDLACKSLANAFVKMAPQARSVWANRRFYRVGFFDVASVPGEAVELTTTVQSLVTTLSALVDKKFDKESKDVQHEV